MKRFLQLLLVVGFVAVLLSGCDERSTDTERISQHADSLMEAAHQQHEFERLLVLADSLEKEGQLSEAAAYYWRGYANDRMGRNHTAEFHWKKALAAVHDFQDNREVALYTKVASRLANLLNMRGEYERSLELTMPTAQKIESIKADTTSDYANLLIFIGCCQSKFGKTEEAMTGNFAHAYEKHLVKVHQTQSDEAYKSAIAGMMNIAYYSIGAHRNEDALLWIARIDTLLNEYRMHPYATARYLDRQQARLYVYSATALEGLGRQKEAASAYHAFKQTHMSKETEGIFLSGNYLVASGRWDEAADAYCSLNQTVDEHLLGYSLENIQGIFLKKYYANLGAERWDTVNAVCRQICDSLDQAISMSLQNDAAELAAIYDTQQKEAQIAEQEARQVKLRQMNAIVMLVVLSIIIAIIMVNRHLHARSVEEKNRILKVANERAEEASRMKTNFIQQISHEIRTPLNILSGFTQVLTSPDMELDEESKRDVNKQISENTERITGLVNKMLELSDANSGSVIERKDMLPAIILATKAVDASRISFAKHLTFDLQMSPEAETATMLTDDKSATRALVLLLDNAIKFTKPAEAYQTTNEQMQRVVLNVEVADNMVRFIVEDSGIGVPAKEAEHIFEEFVQLNDYYDGTGIGLTVARSLARRLGGDVVLDTSYGPGARFILSLPCEASV